MIEPGLAGRLEGVGGDEVWAAAQVQDRREGRSAFWKGKPALDSLAIGGGEGNRLPWMPRTYLSRAQDCSALLASCSVQGDQARRRDRVAPEDKDLPGRGEVRSGIAVEADRIAEGTLRMVEPAEVSVVDVVEIEPLDSLAKVSE